MDIPIDYLADHLEDFEIAIRYVSGQGFLGIIRFEDREVFRTGSFKSSVQEALDCANKQLENNHVELLEVIGK